MQTVAALDLPDCWIAAGFVRDAVWDHLHGFGTRPPSGDIDVVWFGGSDVTAICDRSIEEQLRRQMPDLKWSVKNQARMHLRNGDTPYHSVAHAMSYWPETATAIAARFEMNETVAINAPFGLDDLFALWLRPTHGFANRKRTIFNERVRAKNWINRYPLLILCLD